MADPFRARSTSAVAPVRAPSPDAGMSGIGAGLQQLGRTMFDAAMEESKVADRIAEQQHDIEMAALQRQRSRRIAELAGRWAEEQGALDQALDELRTASAPGAPEHLEKAEAIVTERLRAFGAELGDDPEIVDRFAPLIAAQGVRARQGERQWASAQASEHEATQLGKFGEAERMKFTPASSADELQAYFGAVDMMVSGLDAPGNVRVQVSDAEKAKGAREWILRKIDGGRSADARAVLESGVLDGYIGEKGKAGLFNQVEAAERQAALAAEREASERRDAVRDQLAAAKAKRDAGIVLPAGEIAAIQQAAREAGLDPQDIVAADLLGVDNAVSKAWEGRDATSVRREIRRIEARRAEGKASQAEQASLGQLERIARAADKRETADKKAMLGQGVEGRMGALAALPRDPATRFAQAEEIEAGLGYLAGLSAPVQRFALQGREILAANPKAVDVKAASEFFRKATQAAGMGMTETALSGVLEVANGIYAAAAKQRGLTEFSPREYQGAIRLAFGGARIDGEWTGGLGTVRGRSVLLPDDMTEDGFDGWISRQNFANAVYANGDPAQKADVLASHWPQYVGDDEAGRPRYRFMAKGGRVLRRKDGGDYVVTVGAR